MITCVVTERAISGKSDNVVCKHTLCGSIRLVGDLFCLGNGSMRSQVIRPCGLKRNLDSTFWSCTAGVMLGALS